VDLALAPCYDGYETGSCVGRSAGEVDEGTKVWSTSRGFADSGEWPACWGLECLERKVGYFVASSTVDCRLKTRTTLTTIGTFRSRRGRTKRKAKIRAFRVGVVDASGNDWRDGRHNFRPMTEGRLASLSVRPITLPAWLVSTKLAYCVCVCSSLVGRYGV